MPVNAQSHISQAIQIRELAAQLHHDVPGSFYCGCPIRWVQFKGYPLLRSCGYQSPETYNRRSKRIEWEHVVPVWLFGHRRDCWQKGGRNFCYQRDKDYQQMANDLHNLQPAIGEVNQHRSYYPFVDILMSGKRYGQCEMLIDPQKKRATPPERAKGAIARTYLYMHGRYAVALTQQQKRLFQRWHRHYPASQWECTRHQRIIALQHYPNRYVQASCQAHANSKRS